MGAEDVALSTRLTQLLGIRHPIISAPMAFAAGGRLAAAVSTAGGLGLIGGGYGDADWLDAEFCAAGNVPVGCGFITWSLKKQPQLLDRVLSRSPRPVFLSFGDPQPFAARIKEAGAKLICQVQTRRDAERAIACGADIIVAQGSEAGGHGERRATMTLVPEVADLIAAKSPETLLCAAGGIADGRGLAAALMLGADGVLVGSRLWASSEANVSPRMHAAALAATGDDTIRSQVIPPGVGGGRSPGQQHIHRRGRRAHLCHRAGGGPHRTDGNRGRGPHRRGEKLSSPTVRAPAHYIMSPIGSFYAACPSRLRRPALRQ
jgi:nitronate monooxygenase